jgi:4-hydroxy-tetrahydrodipicolinate synthase
MGARGFTSGLVNVFPERSHAIHRALEAGNYAEARRLIDGIAGFEALRTKYNNGANVTVVKEALGMLGTDVGPVRIPGVVALNETERTTLRGIVNRVKAEAMAA